MNEQRSSYFGGREAIWLALFLVCALVAPSAAQAAPLAGSVIGNRASATYTDGGGVDRTVTSNLVQTTVLQVAAVDLEAANTITGGAGSPVYYPHRVTNNGNGTDSFDLTAVNQGGDTFDLTNLLIYADANNDGVPDNLGAPITSTPSLAPGETFSFVVGGIIPGTQGNGDTSDVLVTAASAFTPATTDANTDTVTVSVNAVMVIRKRMSANSGNSPSGPYTVTIEYTNNGNGAALLVNLQDIVPVGFSYVATSGRWSVSGASVLTEGNDGYEQGSSPYRIDFREAGGTVDVILEQVAASVSGEITFQVNVNAGVAPSTLFNQVTGNFDDGTAAIINVASNTVPFQVLQTAAVSFNPAGPVVVASANQGATVPFTNTVRNDGNGTDTFDITYSGSTFPAGTSFGLFKSDGVTPLSDSNGNGILDTGPIAAGATYNVILKATLPPGAFGGGPYDVTKTATSVFDPAVSTTIIDRLGTITGSTVDVTNTDPIGGAAPTGVGAGPEGAPVETQSGDPGQTLRYVLYVNNTSAVPDSYQLAYSTTTGFSPPVPLPAGYTVTFKDATEVVITATPVIAAGANYRVNADVFIPAGAAPGPQNLYFRAFSSTTLAVDIKYDQLTVNTVRGLQLVPDHTGQVYPGGSVVYAHTITNTGNVTEGTGAGTSTVTLGTAESEAVGFTSVVYWDQNGNGVQDGTDPIISDLSPIGGLAAGASATLFVKVFANAAVAPGTVNLTTFTVTADDGIYGAGSAPAPVSVGDQSTVISGDLQIDKTQALDAGFDGTPDGAYGAATINAQPGQGIRYRIVVTNTGTGSVTNVTINDNTPAFTVYADGDAAVGETGEATFRIDAGPYTECAGANGSHPADGVAGVITATIGTLNPGQTVTLWFGVRVDP